MNFCIKYGVSDNLLDVTNVAYSQAVTQNILYIPSNDGNRAAIFTDPLPGVLKSIFIKDLSTGLEGVFDSSKDIFIDLGSARIFLGAAAPPHILANFPNFRDTSRYTQLRAGLKLDFGTFDDEFPEQMMVVKYLRGDEKVLEIGGNIGRNSMIIAAILNQCGNSQFVCLECDQNSATMLTHNKALNNLEFFIEPSALSNRKLIMQGWNTIVSDVVLEGYVEVQTITLDQLTAKYNIAFDTLVLDCEGAFYYILIDMPQILVSVKTVIMENDYHDLAHKLYINEVLRNNKFEVVHSQAGGWGVCQPFFFEVWQRTA